RAGPASAAESGLRGAVAAQSLLALGRPDLVWLVARRKRRHPFRQAQPWEFAARVNVNIRLDCLRRVQRPGAHEQAVAGNDVIATPQGGAAALAEIHIVGLAGARREPERLRHDRAGLDEIAPSIQMLITNGPPVSRWQ